MRVLIVEDEEKLAKQIKRGLNDEGYISNYCLSGKDGLEKILNEQENLGLIILDLMLPTMDGIEICRRLRRDHINIPILILTAKETTEDKIIGLNSGADDYLIKPFSFEELLARIK